MVKQVKRAKLIIIGISWLLKARLARSAATCKGEYNKWLCTLTIEYKEGDFHEEVNIKTLEG